ncbi:hypothetical protein [Micromonospora sp. U21]|uniref:hypothetical protein n=1 Tax=Micromonospora sp. U21 TaxID=2824899 RepID=UPI001B391BAF|nr:hypothetical protein [Micromonospora sp. U21]MBQ0906345.1 hypothetical protein [Micromonospora sp. U21]
MIVKRKLMAGLATLLLSIGAGAFVATTPAQAALANCPYYDVPGFCLYGIEGFPSEQGPYPGNTPRNTCIQLADFDDDDVYNLTNTRWYVFRTTTCNGSHGEIPPGYVGELPLGYDLGQTHAIMRTSRTS